MRPHPDLDLLALHALGEPVLGADDLAHLAGCARCRTSADELAATVAVVRGPRLDDAPGVRVPAQVWQGIAAELDIDPGVRPAAVGPSGVGARRAGAGARSGQPVGVGRQAPREGHVATVGVTPATPDGPDDGDATTLPAPLSLVRRRPGAASMRLLAAAAAGLAVGGAGTVLLLQQLDEDSSAAPAVLAAADLDAFGAGEGTDVTGSARLAGPATGVEQAAAGRVLELSLADLPDTGGDYLEVWLIDAATGGMVSLGPLIPQTPGGATASLGVPAGVDVATYAVVDVSAEPPDGDPTHSGVSLLRGTLGT